MGLNLIEGIADSGYDRSEHRWAGNPTTCFGLWRPLENAGDNAIKRAITECFFKFCSQPPGEARRGEGKRTIPVTESWAPTCAGQRRWLRGRDLNPGPLGYEPNLSMARLCLSMIYVEVDLRFSTLFWGILFLNLFFELFSNSGPTMAQRCWASGKRKVLRLRSPYHFTVKSLQLLRILSA